MSCSDKLLKWTWIGLQGALLGQIIEDISLSSVIIEVDEPENADNQKRINQGLLLSHRNQKGTEVGCIIEQVPARFEYR